MTKPWEQEWTTGKGEHWGRDVRTENGDSVAFCGAVDATARDVAKFIAAAPDMARALRDALSVLHRAEDVLEMGQVRGLRDACETVEAALRKAGVIL